MPLEPDLLQDYRSVELHPRQQIFFEDQKALKVLGEEGAMIAFIMTAVVSLGIGRLGGAESLVFAFCFLLGVSLRQVWRHVKLGVQERTRCTESAA